MEVLILTDQARNSLSYDASGRFIRASCILYGGIYFEALGSIPRLSIVVIMSKLTSSCHHEFYKLGFD